MSDICSPCYKENHWDCMRVWFIEVGISALHNYYRTYHACDCGCEWSKRRLQRIKNQER